VFKVAGGEAEESSAVDRQGCRPLAALE